MHCPECGKKGRALETRKRTADTTRRRYECSSGHRWTTLEMIVNVERVKGDVGSWTIELSRIT